MNALQRWVLHVSVGLVALSGTAYGLFKYLGARLSLAMPALFPAPDDPYSAVQHPLQSWALDVHVLAAPVLVFATGWIFKEHILERRGPARPATRGARAGVVLLLAAAASGYLVQTVTRESLTLPVVLVHIAGGLAFVLAYLLHVLMAPRNGARRPARSGLRISP
jgi:hypothetical protein